MGCVRSTYNVECTNLKQVGNIRNSKPEAMPMILISATRVVHTVVTKTIGKLPPDKKMRDNQRARDKRDNYQPLFLPFNRRFEITSQRCCPCLPSFLSQAKDDGILVESQIPIAGEWARRDISTTSVIAPHDHTSRTLASNGEFQPHSGQMNCNPPYSYEKRGNIKYNNLPIGAGDKNHLTKCRLILILHQSVVHAPDERLFLHVATSALPSCQIRELLSPFQNQSANLRMEKFSWK